MASVKDKTTRTIKGILNLDAKSEPLVETEDGVISLNDQYEGFNGAEIRITISKTEEIV